MREAQDTTDTSNYAYCLTMRNRHFKHHYVRCIVTSLLMLVNGYVHIIPMPIRAGENSLDAYHFGPLRAAGLLSGILAILVSLLFLALYWTADPEKPRRMFVDMLIFLAAAMVGLVNPLIAVAVAVTFALGFKDCREALWLKQQPGYPQFNERFTEQTEHPDYEALHPVNDTTWEADHSFREDAAGDTFPAVPEKELTWKHSARAARLSTDVPASQEYRITEGSSPDEMAGVTAEDDTLPQATLPEAAPEIPMAGVPELPDTDTVTEPSIIAPALSQAAVLPDSAAAVPALSDPAPGHRTKTLTQPSAPPELPAPAGVPALSDAPGHRTKTLKPRTLRPSAPPDPARTKHLAPPVQTDIQSARAWAAQKPADVPAPAAVPEPASADTIPDPKWDIPEPRWDVPDPVMDTGSILSDIPDIAGDIPDLPDIPDIPEI